MPLIKFSQNKKAVSIKKTPWESQDWFKYFVIASLLIHGALIWSVLIMSEQDGWLAGRKASVERPAYVQVVELPPDYKAPESLKPPPDKPKRYADKTSVVEVEEIPEIKAVIAGPLARAEAPQKANAEEKPSKGAEAGKGERASKASKPSRIFKPKEDAGNGKAVKKIETVSEKKAAALQKTDIKDEKSTMATAMEPVEEGEAALKSGRKTLPEAKNRLQKEILEEEKGLTAEKRDGEEKGRTPPTPGEQSSAEARAPSPPSRPNLLLSERQVTKLRKEYQGSAPTSKSKTLMLNTSELKYQNYLIELKHKIEQYWEYPRLAAVRGWEGKLFIDMTIKRDGTLRSIKLTRSSRFPILDDAAITAIKLSSPFTTFPDDFEIDEINIHGQFVYTLIGMPRN